MIVEKIADNTKDVFTQSHVTSLDLLKFTKINNKYIFKITPIMII